MLLLLYWLIKTLNVLGPSDPQNKGQTPVISIISAEYLCSLIIYNIYDLVTVGSQVSVKNLHISSFPQCKYYH